MNLRIYSLRGTLFDGVSTKLTINTTSGEITILDHHRALISTLKKGTARITDVNDSAQVVAIGGGVLEVKPNNEVTVLVNE
jgi:ATP synthase F1 epsilon subunit